MSDKKVEIVLDDSVEFSEGNEIFTNEVTSITEVTPQHILSFAKCILIGLSILFFIGMVIECCMPNGKVFEACKLTLPPLATLVIGYYFGTTKG
jgi:hypothetical protein